MGFFFNFCFCGLSLPGTGAFAGPRPAGRYFSARAEKYPKDTLKEGLLKEPPLLKNPPREAATAHSGFGAVEFKDCAWAGRKLIDSRTVSSRLRRM